MTATTVTLELPEPFYRLARQMAELTRQPLEAMLRDNLVRTLPPLDDVPAQEADDLVGLAGLSDAALWRAARVSMDATEQAEMHELLDAQGAGEVSPAEQARLQELMTSYGQLTTRKAHAYLLLARRGYRVPMQENAGSAT
jgi:hypothetical protein